MAERSLVDHVDEGWRRLVVHAPATIDHLQLTRGDQAPRERAVGLVPVVIPTLKEGLLDVNEFAI